MNEIAIQVYASRKLSKKTVDIGNMQENKVTKLIFELDKDIVALGGNVYLFVSYDGNSYPYPLKNGIFEVGRELTQRKKSQANIVVSTSTDEENLLSDVVWISNTLTLMSDKNDINIDSINETELPPSLKIVYDDLLNLEKDLREKRDSDYWRGEKGERGEAGSVEFKVVNELPTEDINEGAIYLVPSGTEEIEENGEIVIKNKYKEYIYVNGEWELFGVISVAFNMEEYVKKTDFATANSAGVGKVLSDNGISLDSNKFFSIARATESDIDSRKSYYKPIVAKLLDYAVMSALTNPLNHEWTEEQKQLARTLLNTIGSEDYATTTGEAGIIALNKDKGITRANLSPVLEISCAQKTEIDKKDSKYKALVPLYLDYAVKKALSDCKLSGDDVWTEEEKAKALELMGGVGKVTDTSVMNRVYGIGHSGTDTVIFVLSSGGIDANTIPMRNADGTFYVGTPKEDLHPANKKYVDGLAGGYEFITEITLEESSSQINIPLSKEINSIKMYIVSPQVATVGTVGILNGDSEQIGLMTSSVFSTSSRKEVFGEFDHISGLGVIGKVSHGSNFWTFGSATQSLRELDKSFSGSITLSKETLFASGTTIKVWGR